jgi:Ca2+/Na+ antiporter
VEHGLPYYAQLCTSIDAFNRASARLLSKNSAMVRQSADDLLGVAVASQAASSGVRQIVAAYAAADSITLRHQRRSTRMMQLFFVLGALMVLSFAIYSYQPAWTAALVVYLALFASMAITFRFGRVRENYDSFLDARALAEALRVQFFWRMAGSWEGVAHHYLRKQAEELHWIRDALRSLDIAPPFRGSLPDHLAWARHWILNQGAYLNRSATDRARRLRRLMKYSYRLYTAGLIVSLLVVVASASRIMSSQDPLLAIAVMLMGLAPAFAALWTGYAEFMSLEEDIKSNARMKAIFERAKFAVQAFTEEPKKAEAVSDRPPPGSRDEDAAAQRLRDLLHDLGSEALRENADWLLHHRTHRPKPQMT